MDSVPDPASGAKNGELQTAVIGTSKPLHRFIRGEPKSIGIVMLFLGCSQFIVGIPMKNDISENSTSSFCEFWLGILFFISGLLYILSQKSPSKKLVSASMAVSIVSIIGAVLGFFEFLMHILNFHNNRLYYPDYDIDYDNLTNDEDIWQTYHSNQMGGVEAVLLFYCIIATVLLIVMTTFAKAGLRSSKTQAVVIMQTLPTN